jgi:Bacterial regulatory proteins, luxR family
MISEGLSNKRIARALEISPETVKSHVKHIFLKLEVSTRTEAVFRALSLELAGATLGPDNEENVSQCVIAVATSRVKLC